MVLTLTQKTIKKHNSYKQFQWYKKKNIILMYSLDLLTHSLLTHIP